MLVKEQIWKLDHLKMEAWEVVFSASQKFLLTFTFLSEN